MSQITVRQNGQDVPFNGTNLKDNSAFERRQNTFRQLHNKEVREVFADVVDAPTDGTPYDAGAVTPAYAARRVLRQDVLIEDNDSFSEMWLKRELLKFLKDDDGAIILPNYDDIPITVKDKPHVHLTFIEKKSTAITNHRIRVKALISFRIVEKSVSTMTRSDLTELSREINLAFPSTYTLNKGRIKYSYRDKINGFEFILSLTSETEAKEVITKVLGIRDKTPNWDLLRVSTAPDENFATRENITILGQIEKLPLYRPTATCYFRKAIISFGKLRTEVLAERFV